MLECVVDDGQTFVAAFPSLSRQISPSFMSHGSVDPPTGRGKIEEYRAGQQVVPGYTLVRQLGSGMAGDVWIARAAGGINVAVKIVRSLSEIGGRKELKALRTIRNIQHPNLCPLFGFWIKDAEGRILADETMEEFSAESSVATDFRLPDVGPEPAAMGETMAVGRPASPDVEMGAGRTSEPGKAGPEGEAAGGRDEGAEGRGRVAAEQLIVVMGLGDGTLYDRLLEVRRQAGLGAEAAKVPLGLEAEEVIRYLRGAANAIDLLNRQKPDAIYHCDIKPQNILLVGGEAQVCDFGLAKKVQGDMRSTRQVFATPGYAAPEVLQSQPFGRGVDQYSLAVTYFELRTGLLPFDVTSQANMLIAKCSGKIDLRQVSPKERKVLQRAMHLDPARRYPTCGEFVRAMAVATGVEKAGDLTLGKVIAATIAVTLAAAVGERIWSVAAPDSHRRAWAWVRPEVRPLGERIETAQVKWREHQADPHPSAEVSRERLRNVLADLFPTGPLSDAEQSLLEETAMPIAIALGQEIIASVDASESPPPPSDEGDPSGLRRRFAALEDDLAFLESLSRGRDTDGTTAAVIRKTELTDVLRNWAAIARLDLDLRRRSPGGPDAEFGDSSWTAPPADEATLEAIDRLRKAGPRLAPTWETRAAVSVALARRGPELDVRDPQVLADLARASRSTRASAATALPSWNAQQWKAFEREFLTRLESAYTDPAVDPALKGQIREGWPDLVFRAGLANCEKYLLAGDWERASASFRSLHDDRFDVADPESERHHHVCRLMVAGFVDPDTAPTAIRELAESIDDGRAISSLLKQAAGPWIAELTRRTIANRRFAESPPHAGLAVPTAPDGFDRSLELFVATEGLCRRLGIPIPVDVIWLPLVETLAGGMAEAEVSRLADVLNAAESLADPADLLRSAMSLEMAFLAEPGESDSSIDRGWLRATRQRLAPRSTATADTPAGTIGGDPSSESESWVSEALPPRYWDYLDGVAAWLDGKTSEASSAWSRLAAGFEDGPEADRIRERLGGRRRAALADRLLRLATIESGVADDDVLRRRFFVTEPQNAERVRRARGHVHQARWWLQPGGDALPMNLEERLAIQTHLVAWAERTDPQPAEPPSIGGLTVTARPELLGPPIRRLFSEAAAEDPPFPARHGQLYRSVLEIAKAFFRRPPAGRGDQEPEFRRLLLSAAVGVLETGLGERVDDQAWLEEVLEPVMAVIAPTLSRTGDLPDGLDPRSVGLFLRHYLKTPHSSVADRFFGSGRRASPENYADWLSRLELAAATVASSRELPDDDRVHHWGRAAEFFRQRQLLGDSAIGPGEIEVLREYVRRAEAVVPDRPSSNVMQAFVLLYESQLRRDADRRADLLRQANERLESAIASLESAIPDGLSRRQWVTLYDAYWCNGNVLVQRAFYRGGRDERLADLTRAKRCAESARDLIDGELRGETSIIKNAAFMVLGNSCEDLALYCHDRPGEVAERKARFRDAIDAFDEAVRLTLRFPLKQQIYLSRCLLRYVEHCPLDEDERRERLEQAKRELGQEPRVGKGLRIEWYWLRSRIEERLGNPGEALRFAESGYRQAAGWDDADVIEERDQIIVYYAAYFLKEEPQKTLGLLDQVRDPNRAVYWNWLDLRGRALAQTGDFEALGEVLNGPEFSARSAADMGREAERVMPALTRLSGHLQRAALRTRVGQADGDERVILRGLEAIERVVRRQAFDAQQRPIPAACADLILAYVGSLGETPPVDQARQLAIALDRVERALPAMADELLGPKSTMFSVLRRAIPDNQRLRTDPEAWDVVAEVGESLREDQPTWQLITRMQQALRDRPGYLSPAEAEGLDFLIEILRDPPR